jgi:hypothetical protein
MLLIILLVIFVVVCLLWFLALVGGAQIPPAALTWLPFVAVLTLGVVVFLGASGVVVLTARP